MALLMTVVQRFAWTSTHVVGAVQHCVSLHCPPVQSWAACAEFDVHPVCWQVYVSHFGGTTLQHVACVHVDADVPEVVVVVQTGAGLLLVHVFATYPLVQRFAWTSTHVWGAAVGGSVTTSQHVACVHVDADVPEVVVVVQTGAGLEVVHVFGTYPEVQRVAWTSTHVGAVQHSLGAQVELEHTCWSFAWSKIMLVPHTMELA